MLGAVTFLAGGSGLGDITGDADEDDDEIDLAGTSGSSWGLASSGGETESVPAKGDGDSDGDGDAEEEESSLVESTIELDGLSESDSSNGESAKICGGCQKWLW